jgi:hypothetical protein
MINSSHRTELLSIIISHSLCDQQSFVLQPTLFSSCNNKKFVFKFPLTLINFPQPDFKMQIINANNAVLFTAALACLPALTAGAPVTQDGALAGLSEPLFDAAELEARTASLAGKADLADDQLFDMSDLEARDYNADTIAELAARDIDPKAIMNTLSPVGKSILKAILKLSASEGAELAKKLNIPIVSDAAAAGVKAGADAADKALSRREPALPLLALGLPLFKGLLGGALRMGAGAGGRLTIGVPMTPTEIAASKQNKNQARAVPADEDFGFADDDSDFSELLARDVGVDLKEVAKGASPAVMNILKSLAKLTKTQATQIASQLNVPVVAGALEKVPVKARDVNASADYKSMAKGASPAEKKVLKGLAKLSAGDGAQLAKALGAQPSNNGLSRRDPSPEGIFDVLGKALFSPVGGQLVNAAINLATNHPGANPPAKNPPASNPPAASPPADDDSNIQGSGPIYGGGPPDAEMRAMFKKMGDDAEASTGFPKKQTRDVMARGIDLQALAGQVSPTVLSLLKDVGKLSKSEFQNLATKFGAPGVASFADNIPVKRDLGARNEVVDKIIADAPAEFKSVLVAAANLALPEAKKLAQQLGDLIPGGIQARDPKSKAKTPKNKEPKEPKKTKESKQPKETTTTTSDHSKNHAITTSTSVATPTATPPPQEQPAQQQQQQPAVQQQPAQPMSEGDKIEHGFNTAANVMTGIANLGGAMTGGLGNMLGGVLGGMFNL